MSSEPIFCRCQMKELRLLLHRTPGTQSERLSRQSERRAVVGSNMDVGASDAGIRIIDNVRQQPNVDTYLIYS